MKIAICTLLVLLAVASTNGGPRYGYAYPCTRIMCREDNGMSKDGCCHNTDKLVMHHAKTIHGESKACTCFRNCKGHDDKCMDASDDFCMNNATVTLDDGRCCAEGHDITIRKTVGPGGSSRCRCHPHVCPEEL